MKKLLVCGVSAAALSFASIGAAQANHTLSGAFGQAFLDHMELFAEGNWVNIAINTGEIDASVVLEGQLNIQVSGTEAGNIIPDPAFNEPGVAFQGAGGAVWLEGGQVQFGSIDTTAAGVVAEQHIATGMLTEEVIGLSAFETSSSAAAGTTKTSAAAAFHGTALEFDSAFLNEPKQETFVANIAFNPSDINASVLITGSHIEGAADGTISTLAAGVVATQTISHGFDGSAFHSND